ncbi:hypothetical protein [Sphingosinicella sp. BN140058]|uniref:hypothetical protein n=1 Tax=Sphingosinicella sp. BN140058 TaxID=1892855 RepID=UPI001012EDFC|nr:hypothetical protein [Sphingosinicella sp. BN140058]QAY77479.1 hypothetical protein ETR14_13925 [Sphingosinicella sp. BN140058]
MIRNHVSTLSAIAMLLVAGTAAPVGAQSVRKVRPITNANCPKLAKATTRTPQEMTRAVQRVTAALAREIGTLSPNASSEDAEAAVAFALSQLNESSDVVETAINQYSATPGLTRNVRQALANSRQALLECQPGGTAGLGRSGGNPAGFGASPVIGVGGGGGSNYSTD